MTTANLSVGIDTKPAKAALAELRQELASLSSTGFSFGAEKLQQQIQTSLSNKNFKIGVEIQSDRLSKAVNGALAAAFRTERNVAVNFDGLTKSLQEHLSDLHVPIGTKHVSVTNEAKQKVGREIGAALIDMGATINEKKLKTQIVKVYREAMATAQEETAIALASGVTKALKNVTAAGEAQVGVKRAFLDQSLQNTLDSFKTPHSVKVGVHGETLSASITAALNHQFIVNINAAELTAKVAAAVQAGTGLSHSVGVASSGPAFNPSAMSSAITTALAPAIDRMTNSVSDALKSVQSESAKPKAGAVRVASSISAKTADGVSVRATASEAAEGALAELQALRVVERAEKDLKEAIKAGNSEIAAARRKEAEEALAWAKYRAEGEKEAQRARNEAWKANDAQTQAQRLAAEAAYSEKVKQQIRDRLEASSAAEKAALGFSAYVQNERDALARAQAERAKQQLKETVAAGKVEQQQLTKGALGRESVWAALDAQKQREKNDAFEAAERSHLAQVEALYAAHEASKKVQARQAHTEGLAMASAYYADLDKLAAQSRERQKENARELKKQIAAVYESAKYSATGAYTSQGQKVAGVKAVIDQFGQNAASGFFNNPALLADVPNLENYRRVVASIGQAKDEAVPKVRRNTEAMRQWAQVGNEVHSGARGLAGSLGTLWLTWGSTIPIAAGAAIGSTIRDVFKSGKDLEYQLTFVSTLTGEAAVSFRQFDAAVRGSLVGPVQAAEAMRGLAQNGLSTKDAIAALPAVLNLATAGEMSLSDAALGATGVMEAFGLKVHDLGRVSDVFSKAASLSNTSVAAMVESMKQASQVGDQYHITIEETSAALAVMAKRNITGSAAGTAFRNMLTELAAPSEKAKEAMKKMRLEVFDSSGQVRSFKEILVDLKGITDGLNEKGKLAFLKDIFDERGAKAANAILSDLKQYGDTLDTLKSNSEGFSKSVTDALKGTTEGKLRALVSEFKLNTAEAFDDASGRVKTFIDALRSSVNGDEFKSAITGLTEGTLALTKALVENTSVLVPLGIAWVTGKVVIAAATSAIIAYNTVAGVATAATSRFALAAGALSRAFGWVTLLGSAAYLLYEIATAKGKAAEAADSYSKSLTEANNLIVQENKDLDKRIEQLREENRLLLAGADAANTQAEAKKNLGKASIGVELVNAQTVINTTQKAYDEALKGGDSSLVNRLSAAIDAAKKNFSEIAQRMDLFEAQVQKGVTAKSESALNAALTALNKYSERATELNQKLGQNKFYVPGAAERAALGGAGGENLSAYVKALTAEMNSKLPTYEHKDKKAESELNKEYAARISAEMAAARRQTDALKDQYEFQKKLDDLKYGADRFGPYLAQLLDEAAADEFATKAIRRQEDALMKLYKTKAELQSKGKAFNKADEENFRKEADILTDNIQNLARKQQQDRTLAAARTGLSESKQDSEAARELTEVNKKADEYIAKLKLVYQLKVEDPVTAAKDKASFEVRAMFMESIAKDQKALEDRERARLDLAIRAESLDGEELAKAAQIIQLVDSQLTIDRARLAVLKETAGARAKEAGVAAGTEVEKSQTAEAGWSRFWENYVKTGTSAAETVYSALKSSTDKMEDALSRFVETGKLDFKGLIRSIMADLAKMQIKGFLQSLAGSSGGGSGGILGSLGELFGLFGGGTTSGGASIPSGMSASTLELFGWANGGIMTPNGPMPLRSYSGGGVATSPQLALFGEGSHNEAYVPLPDGRNIPVVLGGNKRGSVTINYSPVIHVDSTSDRAQTTAMIAQITAEGNKRLVEQLREEGILA